MAEVFTEFLGTKEIDVTLTSTTVPTNDADAAVRAGQGPPSRDHRGAPLGRHALSGLQHHGRRARTRRSALRPETRLPADRHVEVTRQRAPCPLPHDRAQPCRTHRAEADVAAPPSADKRVRTAGAQYARSGRHPSAPSGRAPTTATAGDSGRKPAPGVERLLIVLSGAELTPPLPGRPSAHARL